MKNAITKKAKKTALLVNAVPPTPDMEPAARINHWHEIAKQSGQMAVAAAMNAGIELFKAKIDRPGLFDKWVESNCNFGRRTAYKYLSLVQQALSSDDLPKLAQGSDKERKSAVEQFAANTDSKTLTELYCDFGIVKKTPSKMGGRREGAGRKRKDAATEEAAAIEEAAFAPSLLYAAIKEPLETILRTHRERHCFDRMDLGDLGLVARTLQELAEAAAASLKTRVESL